MRCRHCNGTGEVPDWRIFGAKVRKARESKGLGLREVARRAECSAAYVSDMERGMRGAPGWHGPKARRVLAIVGVRP